MRAIPGPAGRCNRRTRALLRAPAVSAAAARGRGRSTLAGEARHLREVEYLAAILTVASQLVEPRNLLLAEPARRMLRGQRRDQVLDPVADLQREVRGGRAHQ